LRQQVLGDGELPDTSLAALLEDHDTARAARKNG
jgi:hypothetical protein